MSILYESIQCGLGSRFDIHFIPHKKRVLISPLGSFYDNEMELCVGVTVGDQTRILPFSSRYPAFQTVEEELTPNAVIFYGSDPVLGVNAKFEFISPFYPQDTLLSTAPFFYLRVSVEYCGQVINTGDAILTGQGGEELEGQVLVELDGEFDSRCETKDGFSVAITSRVDPALATRKWLNQTKGRDFSSGDFHGEISLSTAESEFNRTLLGFASPFRIKKHQTASQLHLIAGYTNEKVLFVRGELYQFLYTKNFDSLKAVSDFAITNRKKILEKADSFDQAIFLIGWDKSSQSLLAFSLQSFRANAWWMINDRGEEWFSVWEGSCVYHSTIDVEYNCAVFYLLFWPDLLKTLLEEWKGIEKDGGYLSHDMGKFLYIDGMEYGHDMEVEETANYILLTYAYYCFSGDRRFMESSYEQLKRLAAYIRNSDTTGNGFPNTGTSNTFDDAGPAVQYSKEQSYLAIKTYAALLAVSRIADDLGDEKTKTICTEQMEKIVSTLEKEAWLGDHYAVCITRSAEKLIDVWTGKQLSGDIPGWDAASINTCGGLTYLLMTGAQLTMGTEHFATDIATATKSSMRRYACSHSSGDITGNFWISQNIWKDITACYLGLDMSQSLPRYWDYELLAGTRGEQGCFADSSAASGLYCYPRGVDSFGLIYALGGVKFDAVKRTLDFSPVRLPAMVPLYHLADWNSGQIPTVYISCENGVAAASVTHWELLKGFTIRLFGRDIQPEVK